MKVAHQYLFNELTTTTKSKQFLSKIIDSEQNLGWFIVGLNYNF